MTKKRGFTLVEILVVLAITTLVLAMVGGLLIFMADTSGKLIHKSEELMLVQSIETYLRGVLEYKDGAGNVYEPKSITVNREGNTYELSISYSEDPPPTKTVVIIFDKNADQIKEGDDGNSRVIFKDTGLKTFDIYYANADGERDDGGPFVHCELVFTPTGGSTPGSHTYDFIIGIKKQDN
jgi:prepilin-type N-terminal cleavage/methylation domain-containing protein